MIHTSKEKVFGMMPYIAPELRYRNPPPYSVKTDIYSLGVLLWEISNEHPPFEDEVLEDLPDTPTDYSNLYKSCWSNNPDERPDIKDVYNKLKSMLPKDIISAIEDEKLEDIKKVEDEKVEDNKKIDDKSVEDTGEGDSLKRDEDFFNNLTNNETK
jgi:serine/threonine protein kinase